MHGCANDIFVSVCYFAFTNKLSMTHNSKIKMVLTLMSTSAKIIFFLILTVSNQFEKAFAQVHGSTPGDIIKEIKQYYEKQYGNGKIVAGEGGDTVLNIKYSHRRKVILSNQPPIYDTDIVRVSIPKVENLFYYHVLRGCINDEKTENIVLTVSREEGNAGGGTYLFSQTPTGCTS